MTPSGADAALSPAPATIPAGGSVSVTATFTDSGTITTGSKSYALTATDAADNQTASASADVHYTDDLALHAYQTPWPQPSASSSQSGYDGSTATTVTPTTAHYLRLVMTGTGQTDQIEELSVSAP